MACGFCTFANDLLTKGPLLIDPLIPLAISMQASPGVYAVLLGSGVSRSAGIPTGWEVQLDLIRRVATLEKENAGSDPEDW